MNTNIKNSINKKIIFSYLAVNISICLLAFFTAGIWGTIFILLAKKVMDITAFLLIPFLLFSWIIAMFPNFALHYYFKKFNIRLNNVFFWVMGTFCGSTLIIIIAFLWTILK
ncbi:hypothetical protein [Clostridium sp.]|uniref:hypothetical protein n=1 Tax=Clostridium sp. TaxID=1506 RepID=UPI002FCA3C0A